MHGFLVRLVRPQTDCRVFPLFSWKERANSFNQCLSDADNNNGTSPKNKDKEISNFGKAWYWIFKLLMFVDFWWKRSKFNQWPNLVALRRSFWEIGNKGRGNLKFGVRFSTNPKFIRNTSRLDFDWHRTMSWWSLIPDTHTSLLREKPSSSYIWTN